MPDTLFNEYKNIPFEEITNSGGESLLEKVPAKWKSDYKTITTKVYFKDCNDCVYEEYIDSLEIRSGYDKIILGTEVSKRDSSKLVTDEEWAWVKMYKEIPKNHKPCLDVDGIDTCLWKYVIIQHAKYKNKINVTKKPIFDTIKIAPQILPIKKYKLKNKSSQEIEKLTPAYEVNRRVEIHTIEKEEKIREIAPDGDFNLITTYRKRLVKEVTPLNYSD